MRFAQPIRRSLSLACLLLFFSWNSIWAQQVFVSPQGNDHWKGTSSKPVATLQRAQQLARNFGADKSVEVILKDGIYYLTDSLVFTPEDSKTYPAMTVYRAEHPGKAVISGGKRLTLKWRPTAGNVYVAEVPAGIEIDQLYVNGQRQDMARFPNAIPGEGNNVYDTWSLEHKAETVDSMNPLNKQRIRSWSDPRGAYLHAMHASLWGDMHWLVTGKKADGTLNMTGGWQNNRPSPIHPLFRFIENVREELDVPREWYHDHQANLLYYIPQPDTDLSKSVVETVSLKNLISFQGSMRQSVSGIMLQGLVFRHTARTFMENKEPLLRSDWTICRNGAVLFNGAEHCVIKDCEFDQLGGNAIFVNNYNRWLTISGCYLHDGGANGIAFVGNPRCVRSPLFRYGPQDYEHMDRTAGPQHGWDFPQECVVTDCIICHSGRFEKQTAPVQISMSYRITVDHCSIYDVPRAGINISEGTFGGHLIQYCDVFNTVLETGDHGSFNSWGRDRFWTPDVSVISDQVAKEPGLPFLDILEPVTLRNNRFRCDHGWDIDLDDGSSCYRIYNNLLLNGGIKLREGFDRIVTNNIVVNNSLHPHVWPKGSNDIFKHNIVFDAYRPAVMSTALGDSGHWGKEIDYNFFVCADAQRTKFAKNGTDTHSLSGNPRFMNPAAGCFEVDSLSPALRIGFHNFDMDHCGVMSSNLKAIVKTPKMPVVRIGETDTGSEDKYETWLGATIMEPKGEMMSAFGVSFDQGGVAFTKVPDGSQAAREGFRTGDLLVRINNYPISNIQQLRNCWNELQQKKAKRVYTVVRNQKKQILR